MDAGNIMNKLQWSTIIIVGPPDCFFHRYIQRLDYVDKLRKVDYTCLYYINDSGPGRPSLTNQAMFTFIFNIKMLIIPCQITNYWLLFQLC